MPRGRSPRGIVEVDFNLVFTDDDLLGNGVDDASLPFVREARPTLVEALCPQEDLFFGKLADLHDVELGLNRRNLVVDLPESVGPRMILCAESKSCRIKELVRQASLIHYHSFTILFAHARLHVCHLPKSLPRLFLNAHHRSS